MNRHICCGKSAKKGLHAVEGPKEESKLAWERKAGGCGRGVGVGGGMSLMSRLYSYVSALWVNGANVWPHPPQKLRNALTPKHPEKFLAAGAKKQGLSPWKKCVGKEWVEIKVIKPGKSGKFWVDAYFAVRIMKKNMSQRKEIFFSRKGVKLVRDKYLCPVQIISFCHRWQPLNPGTYFQILSSTF